MLEKIRFYSFRTNYTNICSIWTRSLLKCWWISNNNNSNSKWRLLVKFGLLLSLNISWPLTDDIWNRWRRLSLLYLKITTTLVETKPNETWVKGVRTKLVKKREGAFFKKVEFPLEPFRFPIYLIFGHLLWKVEFPFPIYLIIFPLCHSLFPYILFSVISCASCQLCTRIIDMRQNRK